MVRDLGGHRDVTHRSWGCILSARVKAVLRVVWLVSALPLDLKVNFVSCALSLFLRLYMGLKLPCSFIVVIFG